MKPQDDTLADGTFVEVPRQHNTKEENAQIKNGEVPESFAANKHKLAQKDCDAFWKLIWSYAVTTARVHDSDPYLDVIPEEPRRGCEQTYADSAYSGKAIAAELVKCGYVPLICEKGYRNHPLT